MWHARPDAMAVRTGQVFLVRKVILEFSEGQSRRANLSVRTETVRMLLGVRPDTQITSFFLSFPMKPISSQSDI
jgi:hypothetical protein